MAHSITTVSILAFSIKNTQHYCTKQNAILLSPMLLSVYMILGTILMSVVVVLSVIMSSVIMLNTIILSAIMQKVIC
jgi:hypothetical protein